MKLPRKKRDETSAALVQTLWLVLVCSGLLVLSAYASDPAWWSSPGTSSQSAVMAPQVITNSTTGVVTTNYVPNNYAVVTQGQLKQFTARAVNELNATLSGGAGTNLNSMVQGWTNDYYTNGYNATNIKPSDYTAMNVGQLKTIAGMVYGRLSAAGYTELTPSWLHQNTNTDNAVANLGQLKQLFDFDLSLPGISGLTATAGASGTINLSWTLPSTNNVTSWLIEEQNANGTWNILTNLANPDATNYSVSGLTNGQSYNFQVIGSGTNSVSLPISASGTPTGTAPTPSPGPGRYLSSQTITVTSTMADVTIYYTTDGTDPTTSSSSISNGGQLTVNSNKLYKFIAISGSTTSSETTALYRIDSSGDLEAGDSFTMVRKPDGTVWTWGDDGRGQQGDNQANNPAAQPQQVPNLTGITRVAAAGDHALAVKNDGTAWAWGADDQSQGGDGGTSDLLVPTQITGLSNIAAVYAGEFQGFAVDNSGNLYAWGTNDQGQLGDGTTNNQGTPEAIGSITGVVKVVSSPNHTLLLKSDGTVWATGDNSNGELGDGTYNNALIFQQVPGLTNVVDIAAGCDGYGGHSMALLADGSVWTWGVDWYGELGDGNFNAGSAIPELIIVPPAVAIVAVDSKSYVVLADGTVRCFGGNSEGEMGIETTQDQASPVEPTGINNVSLLAAGTYHAVVCTATGAFYGWGDNSSFRLTQDFSNFTPNTEVHDDAALGFTSVASAETATIGLKSDGTVWAVGNGSDGLLGQGEFDSFSTKSLIQIPGLSNISQIAGGEDTAFAIDNNGTLWAWGQNGNGQLGVSNTYGAPLNVPTQVLNVQNVGSVAAGDAHMLAVQWDGTVWVTGDDTDGELGDGTTNPEVAPIPVTALNSIIAKAAAAGSNTSFVLDSNGNVWAWGKNDSGQLGLGTTGDVATPTQITGLSAMVAISARFGNAMGIDSSGNVWTWGGMGNSDGTPLQQPGLSNVIAVAAGGFHQLAIESDGTLWGWGIGGQGQLGNGSYNIDYSPTQLTDVQGAVAVAANYESSCLVKDDGSLSGFGLCTLGEHGANLGVYNYSPKPLFGIALNEAPPTVSITSPSAGASSLFGNAIQFQTSASASTGSIAKVDYYLEGVKLGTSTTSETWNFSYTPASYGDYTFEAVAYDTAGVATISTPVTINVSIASPTVAIVSGNNQTGTSGAFLPNAFVVSVTNSSGTALANTTVTFSVMQGTGLIGTSTTASPSNSIQVTTDANGNATAYFKQPLVANYTSAISVTVSNLTGQSSTSFTATTPVDNGAPAAPTNLTATAGGSGEIDLAWANNADNAASIQVQQQNSDGSWTTVATLNPNQSFAAITGLTLGTNYNFQVLAINAAGQAQIGLNTPTQAQGPSRYAIIDLGVDMNPLQITDTGFVLMGDDEGNYYRWVTGTSTELTVPSNYTISEVTSITEDGTIIGDGLDPSNNSVLLTWYQTYSAATISYPPQSGGAAGSISSPYIDPSFNVWSTQPTPDGYATDGFYNDVEIGSVAGHLGPLIYPDWGDVVGSGLGFEPSRHIYDTGYAVVPMGVNILGNAACTRTDFNLTTTTDISYPDSPPPLEDDTPQTVTSTVNSAPTITYLLSTNGSSTGTALPFKPIALSNANGILGQSEQNGPYAYWDSTGTTTLSSDFTPGSVNAALDSNSNPAYQILGNDGGGNLQLLEMNPQTGQFPATPTDITAYIPQDSPWTYFSAIFGVGASQVINDSGAIVGTATYSGTNYPTGSHGVMLLPFGLVSDLNNDGKIDSSDAGVKAAGQSPTATAAQIAAATEYAFVYDPNAPATTSTDVAEQIQTTCGATFGAIWFEHPAIASMKFYKTSACNSSDQITFPFILSPTNPLPSTMYVRVEGTTVTQEVDGNLVMKLGTADKSQTFCQDQISLSVVKQLGDPKFFQAARNYILERNAQLYSQNCYFPVSSPTTTFRICVMREEATTMSPYESYYNDALVEYNQADPSHNEPFDPVDYAEGLGIEGVMNVDSTMTVVINGNQCGFSDGTTTATAIIDYYLGEPVMTDRCQGRLVIGGVENPSSSDVYDPTQNNPGTQFKGSPLAGPDPDPLTGGPGGKYIVQASNGAFSVGAGQAPLNVTSGMGGLSGDYALAERNNYPNSMVGYAPLDGTGKGVVFVACGVDFTNGNGGVVAFYNAAQASGVPTISGATASEGLAPIDLFLLDSGNTSPALAHQSPSGTLQLVLEGSKQTGFPYYTNTFLRFKAQVPRPSSP